MQLSLPFFLQPAFTPLPAEQPQQYRQQAGIKQQSQIQRAADSSHMPRINQLAEPQHQGPWGKDVAYWDDEIHPNSQGFTWLVEKAIGPALHKLLP